jgi:hypothetical protein
MQSINIRQATDFVKKGDSKLQNNEMMVNRIVIQGPASLSTQNFPPVRLPNWVKHTLTEVSDKVHMHNSWQ